MSNKNIFSLVLKFLGVYSLYRIAFSLQGLIVSIPMFFNPTAENFIASIGYWGIIVVGVLFNLIVGIVLIRYSDSISEKIIKEEKEIQINIGENWDRNLFALSLKIVGVICLTKAIPQLGKSLIYIQGASPKFHITTDSNLFVAILSIMIGLYLLMAGKFIINLAFKNKHTPNK